MSNLDGKVWGYVTLLPTLRSIVAVILTRASASLNSGGKQEKVYKSERLKTTNAFKSANEH